MTEMITDESAAARVVSDKVAYIRLSREGIAGSFARDIVSHGGKEAASQALHTQPRQLSRYYQRKSLSPKDSEAMLDTLKTVALAQQVWGKAEAVDRWMNQEVPALAHERPVELMDTFVGRQWIRDVLNKIKAGDFS